MMARRARADRDRLFPQPTEPVEEPVAETLGELDSTEEVTTEPTEESISIPVYPCSSQLTKISDDWAIVRHTDLKMSAMFSLDRHQLIELGSAMLKCGQSMPSPKQIEKAAKRSGERTLDSGLVVPE
jgi:hypothetical protein